MPRKKLEMTSEERRLYNNKKHREQTKKRRERAEREVLKTMVKMVANSFEKVGWDKIDLIVGSDDEMIEAVTDDIINSGELGVTLGSKPKIKLNNKEGE